MPLTFLRLLDAAPESRHFEKLHSGELIREHDVEALDLRFKRRL